MTYFSKSSPIFSEKFSQNNHSYYVAGMQYSSFPVYFFDFLSKKGCSLGVIGFASILWNYTFSRGYVGVWSVLHSNLAQVASTSQRNVRRYMTELEGLGLILKLNQGYGLECHYAWNMDLLRERVEMCRIEKGLGQNRPKGWDKSVLGDRTDLSGGLGQICPTSYLECILKFNIEFFLKCSTQCASDVDKSQAGLSPSDDKGEAVASSVADRIVAAWLAAVELVATEHNPAHIDLVLSHGEIDFLNVESPAGFLISFLGDSVRLGKLLFQNPEYDLSPEAWLEWQGSKFQTKNGSLLPLEGGL